MLDEFARSLNPRTRLVAVTHLLHALGSGNAAYRIVDCAHAKVDALLIEVARPVGATPHN